MAGWLEPFVESTESVAAVSAPAEGADDVDVGAGSAGGAWPWAQAGIPSATASNKLVVCITFLTNLIFMNGSRAPLYGTTMVSWDNSFTFWSACLPWITSL